MAKVVIDDLFLTVGGADYTAEVESAVLNIDREELPVTNADSAIWKEILAGVKSWSLEVSLKEDAVKTGFNAAMWTAWDAGSDLAVVFRNDDSDGVSTSNPNWSGNVKLLSWKVAGGTVGQAEEQTVTYVGNGALARATA